jgi:hypothetical protein
MCKVRCADCGFLSVRDYTTRAAEEADHHLRASGEKQQRHDLDPVCFVGAFNLPAELTARTPAGYVAVVSKERACGEFTPWQQSYSPREHKEMLITQQLQKYQEEQREKDRQWQAEQRERDRLWQEQQKTKDLESQQARDREQRLWQEEQARRTARRTWAIALLGAAIGIVGATLGKNLSAPPPQQQPIVNVIVPEPKATAEPPK